MKDLLTTFASEGLVREPTYNRTAVSTNTGTVRLAVIDDDSAFITVLERRLESGGWEFQTRPTQIPAEELLAMKLNALVLDISILGSDGWSYLEEVCSSIPGLGVIVCTGRSTVAQRVRGLRLGADDWIAKPCHPEEVMARVEAVVRRRRRATARVETGPVVSGELEVRGDQFQAFVSGRSVGLTRREFELLQLLAEGHGQVIEREEIYQKVWGYAMAHGDRSVDVFVRKLRQKLKRFSGGWTYIHTHFGIGYRFDPEPAGGADADVPKAVADGEAAQSDSQLVHGNFTRK